MNEIIRKNALLPSGFEDLLPPQADGEFAAISALMKTFATFGYARVKPPMAEFEESLLGDGPGAALSQETFRVMDPISHRMMALRSDITAQIARIAQSRLFDEPRPLRITYANDVIRTKASQQRTLRQFCQAGCEMIGMDSAASDIEIAVVALSGLKALDVKEASLDFAIPRLLDCLFEEFEVPAEKADVVRSSLKSRDASGLSGLSDKKLVQLLTELLNISGAADKALGALQDLKLPKGCKAIVQRLDEVISGTQAAMLEMGLECMNLTLDPLETKGFDYHSGVAFTLFAKGARGELGRGGRYTIFNGEQDTGSAAGFTFYMDSLRQVMAIMPEQKVIFIPADESWTLVKNLQNEGWRTVRGLGAKEAPSGCMHIYKKGKIEEIS
jgi:ATP phosphoribosyltransferase regulatory subunit